jgi:pimeloyl-ACP methyl ester carboxylesterase
VRRAAVALSAFALAADLRAAGASLALTPCKVPGLDRELKCGTLEVFEDRASKSGRRIPIRVTVMPATGAKKEPDPLLYFTGGPGEAGWREAPLIATEWADINRTRDVVLVDLRGTGHSNGLICSPELMKKTIQQRLDEFLPKGFIEACRAEVEPHADLRLYTTSLAVDDADDILNALGYGKVNVGGGSYGTRAAQIFVRRHPARVRSLFLWDVVPPGARMPVTFAHDAQGALDGLLAACRGEAACRAAFPDTAGELAALMAKLEKEPAPVEAVDPVTHAPLKFTLSRNGLALALRYLLYSPKTAARIPFEIHRAAEGDLHPIASSALEVLHIVPEDFAEGFYLSVTCAEDVAFFDEAEARANAKGTFLGDSRWKSQVDACSVWRFRPEPKSFMDPLVSSVAALLIDGTLDPVNPPSFVDRVARALPHSKVAMVPRGAHDFEGMEGASCIDDLIAKLIQTADEKALDTSCVARIKPAPFQLSPR